MDYHSLKNYVIDILNQCENVEKIIELAKDNYYNVINSRRKIDKVKSPNDVFSLLEKRTELSKDNIKPFYYMVAKLPDNENALKVLDSYLQSHSGISEKSTSNVIKNDTKFSNATLPVHLGKIHEIISDEIGNNWRNLARYLKIQEGEIEIIDLKFGNDLKSKIWAILKYFEKNTDLANHIESLCNVLEKCRRKDLKLKILKMTS